MYFGSFGNNNICLRGNNAGTGTQNPANQAGFFNHALVTCFSWPYWTTSGINTAKSSWGVATMACFGSAAFNAGAAPTSTDGNAARYRNKDRPFGCNIVAGTGMDSVRFTSFVNNAAATSYQGYANVGLSNRQNYLGITGVVSYGNSFDGWRNVTSSGTILGTVLTTNIFFNGTYGGTFNFKDINTMVATAS